MNIFKRFLIYLAIVMLCSLIPWLHIGVLFGFPSILINSIVLTFIYAKDMEKVCNVASE